MKRDEIDKLAREAYESPFYGRERTTFPEVRAAIVKALEAQREADAAAVFVLADDRLAGELASHIRSRPVEE